METVARDAVNPKTGEISQIDFPAPEVVRQAILKLDFPPKGIKIKDAANKLTEFFHLTAEQKNAKRISNGKYIDLFYYEVAASFRNLKNNEQLDQPGGKRTPYFLVKNEDREENQKKNREKDVPTGESIEDIYQKVHKELAEELLDQIKSKKPAFFEELVIDLLVAMGYGGSRADAEAVGRSGDGGIDGIINEDRLGLDVVYVQAKRWEANIGEPPIRDFVGALDGEGAQKGIFITTSDFSSSAERFADRSTKKIVLINGKRLAELMIEHDIGVSTAKTYEIKRVDSDYFAETE